MSMQMTTDEHVDETMDGYCAAHDFWYGRPRPDHPDDDEEQRLQNKVVLKSCPECDAEDWQCSPEGICWQQQV